ncbi:hypothetical protein GCM10020367_58660 [Streptomyces sannanensis]|uniref:Uncharacterized protein n=1 Tax=Streptomyces sannanensis TaxID=285536 RepID=A0ABP6SJN2_9ACTN
MDSELATLAASGATTLVSLLVTDSWTHARELVRRFFSRIGSDGTAIADLDTARTRLLAAETAGNAQTTREIRDQWHAFLRHLLQEGSVTGDDLRDLLTSLQGVANADTQQSAVHNTISGGAQYGPVIQSGRISRLTFHVDHPTAPA